MKAVLIRNSTGEILKRSEYPREDMALLEGLDPDLEWLLVHEPSPIPSYDQHLYYLDKTESITSTPHPDYPHLNQFQITYSTVRKSNNEIKDIIENKENEVNESILPFKRQLKLMALSIGILMNNADPTTWTNKEKAIRDKMINVALRIWNNDQLLRNKLSEVDSGGDPLINDPGWDSGNPVTTI